MTFLTLTVAPQTTVAKLVDEHLLASDQRTFPVVAPRSRLADPATRNPRPRRQSAAPHDALSPGGIGGRSKRKIEPRPGVLETST